MMVRTLVPKILALLLMALAFALWPWPLAAGIALGIALASAALLILPVFLTGSNYYVRTHVRAQGESAAIALTFDDGPDRTFTPAVLDILRAEGVRATFFAVGERLERNPALARRILDEGHVLGCHSQTHGLDFHFKPKAKLLDDLEAFDRVTERVAGVRCRLFRSPQGFRTPLLGEALRAARRDCVNWSVRGYDAVEQDPDKIWRKLSKGLRPGAIVLMHDGSGLGGSGDRAATLAVLPRLIREVKNRGLAFATVDALLGLEAYSETL